jgi:hypothetical protein
MSMPIIAPQKKHKNKQQIKNKQNKKEKKKRKINK